MLSPFYQWVKWGLGKLEHLPKPLVIQICLVSCMLWGRALCHLRNVSMKSTQPKVNHQWISVPFLPLPPPLLFFMEEKQQQRSQSYSLVSLDSMKPVYLCKYSFWKGLERRNQNIENYSHSKNNKLNSWVHLWPQPLPRGGPGQEHSRSCCPWLGRSRSLSLVARAFQWCSPKISQAPKVLRVRLPHSLLWLVF